MAVIYQAAYRRASSLFCRLHSTYVRKMRYLNELKEDDSFCRQAQTSGTFSLFHNLSPFLQKAGRKYLVPQLSATEMKRILEKFRETEQWIEKSVLIGCSDEHIPHFALDLGALEKSVIESELEGSFTDIRKALFVVDEKDSPLLASAQALLQWHDSHQYCSKTGQPTHKNVAGSKRVCHASGIIYYPQMSPVVITLVSDGSRCLLARQPSFPPGMYTALSGFCDLGETVEEALRREVAEEVGLEVESFRYSASQHWPFPSSCLMIACHALVRAQQTEISMSSLELEAARWFGLEEIMEVLKRDHESSKQEDGSFLPWFPPKQAIAHHLIQEWVKQQTSWTA
ncbi:NAD(P)H pyrophosphatase NUDT13, mitochondrial [Struthio camelus]|uniref:NAD(P)H pyrophosphatase NUDT13, mitochondrial n=1 Tax=Struthio camelus TaxID=8801 RepID=UPI00051E4875|nr:PREDICTED: nucleoside diphosphate-linked moiety X motif 13 [Struthio camelus australis]XP_009673663.1 PREDICTED: nucleoside diphosphate-linked moiety X motif 13 [Struthio camelus australis]XP_009673666.1 PREDICTED: nucleoside diphosphate-linked moiety X motif 13 [Struthio camelus australis]